VEVESESVLRGMSPDFKLLATVNARGFIVTSRSSDPRFDFVSQVLRSSRWDRRRPRDWICPIAAWEISGGSGLGRMNSWRTRHLHGAAFVKVRVTKDRAFLGGRAVIVARENWLVGNKKREAEEMQQRHQLYFPSVGSWFRQLGQYQGAGVLMGSGLFLRHLAQRKRLALKAVFGRDFFPVLRNVLPH